MGGKRVVFVDDDRIIGKMISCINSVKKKINFPGEAHFLFPGEKIEETAEKILSLSPNLVVLDCDYQLDYGGPDLAKELKKHNPQISIIFMSGDSDNQKKVAPNLLIAKPFSLASLSQIINQVLSEK